MRFKTKIVPMVFLFLILFYFINYAYSGLKSKFSELRMAYINGYYEALQLDIEQIKILQSDKDLMKEAVLGAADNYITILDDMNKK